MNYYDIECPLHEGSVCKCTKPFDAENARYGDLDTLAPRLKQKRTKCVQITLLNHNKKPPPFGGGFLL